MKVTVRVYATLRRYLPEGSAHNPIELELPDGATVGELLKRLGLPQDAVKVVFVNGRHAEFEHPLADGDQVGVFPPVAGG